MRDSTESMRRELALGINRTPEDRENLEKSHGEVWDTKGLKEDFEVHRFLAPFAVVKNKRTSEAGTIMFQHKPRFYFRWKPVGEPEEMDANTKPWWTNPHMPPDLN